MIDSGDLARLRRWRSGAAGPIVDMPGPAMFRMLASKAEAMM